MFKAIDKNAARKKKHFKVRKKISGTAQRPRLCVFRSNKHIYAQIIDDVNGVTLVAASTLEAPLKDELTVTSNKDAAKEVGKLLGEKALAKGIETVVFDRGGYIYHGRIASLADGARDAGLKF